MQYVQSLLAEVEHRIRRGHAPLALSQNQQSSGAAGPKGKNEEKIQVLADKIDVLLHQIEELGSEGKVEEAQGMMKLVEQLKEERELLRSTTSVSSNLILINPGCSLRITRMCSYWRTIFLMS